MKQQSFFSRLPTKNSQKYNLVKVLSNFPSQSYRSQNSLRQWRSWSTEGCWVDLNPAAENCRCKPILPSPQSAAPRTGSVPKQHAHTTTTPATFLLDPKGKSTGDGRIKHAHGMQNCTAEKTSQAVLWQRWSGSKSEARSQPRLAGRAQAGGRAPQVYARNRRAGFYIRGRTAAGFDWGAELQRPRAVSHQPGGSSKHK